MSEAASRSIVQRVALHSMMQLNLDDDSSIET